MLTNNLSDLTYHLAKAHEYVLRFLPDDVRTRINEIKPKQPAAGGGSRKKPANPENGGDAERRGIGNNGPQVDGANDESQHVCPRCQKEFAVHRELTTHMTNVNCKKIVISGIRSLASDTADTAAENGNGNGDEEMDDEEEDDGVDHDVDDVSSPEEGEAEAPEHACPKCKTSFGHAEALDAHLAENSCKGIVISGVRSLVEDEVGMVVDESIDFVSNLVRTCGNCEQHFEGEDELNEHQKACHG